MGTYLPKVSLMSFKEGRNIDFPGIGPPHLSILILVLVGYASASM